MKEIVIKIDDEVYEKLFTMKPMDLADQIAIDMAIKHGKVLPKGHGELKDANKIEEALDLVNPNNKLAEALKNIIETVPTLVEADKEKE